jgi:hypothetical protein
LAGVPFDRLQDTVYRVTAIEGEIDIFDTRTNSYLARGLTLDQSGTVRARVRAPGQLCRITGVIQEYVYDYVFQFQLAGTGNAAAHWTYGHNTNCAVCTVDDQATLRRVTAGSR